MPEPPASSHLLGGKRGGGAAVGGGGGPVAPPTAPGSTSVASESSAGGQDRGRGQDRRRDDLTSSLSYNISEVDSAPSAASCDVGRSIAVPFAPGITPSSSGGYVQELDANRSPPLSTAGMDLPRLQQHLSEFTDSLFAEGLLDDQFTQLQLLQDANNPDFVAEVVSLFFDDSEKLLEQLSESLEGEPIDYKKVDAHVHQFKGSSSSIGAQRVKNVCVTFRACCEDENMDGCRQALVQVKQEFKLVKAKLETMLALEQQILAAGGSLPFME